MFPNFPNVVYESGLLNNFEPYIVIAGRLPPKSHRTNIGAESIDSINVLTERSSSPDVFLKQDFSTLFYGNDINKYRQVKSILISSHTPASSLECIPRGYDTASQIYFPDGIPPEVKVLPTAEAFFKSNIEPLMLSSHKFWLRLKNLIYPDEELQKYINDLEQFLESPDKANHELAYQFMESFGVPDALRMRIIETPERKLLSLKYNTLEALNKLEQLSLAGLVIDVLPENLTKLERLNSLDLSNTKIQVLPDFVEDLALESLNLSGNDGIDLPQLFTLLSQNKTLKMLLLDFCQISHLPKEAFLMTNLKELYLRNNYYLSAEDIEQLKQALPGLDVIWQEDI